MKRLIPLIAAALLIACGPRLPKEYTDDKALPRLFPDVTNVTIPPNIAPLTFQMDSAADEMVATYTAGTLEYVYGGDKIQPDADQWRELIQQARGKDIRVQVYARYQDTWTRYQPFSIFVANDSIDPWLSYRLIAPSFVSYEELTISQRCLEDYDERVIYDNMLCSIEPSGQCINCHDYQAYNPARMQFHARQNLGGTVIAYDGHVEKINMKNDSLLSAGVYPAWHPTLPLIAYSTNNTHQSFFTTNRNKIEVFDSESDLIVYDVSKNEVTNIENDPDEFEVFPFWVPDGKCLYYCSAHFERQDSTRSVSEVLRRGMELKYNIYRKDFDPDSRQFGPRQLVFDAAAIDRSATLPRISPDGRWLVFAMAPFGVFHIWHRDADLWMMDLTNGNVRALDECNSDETESYHSWSTNGRWLVFSSRRDDGDFTRPYFAHFSRDGRFSKPFELPVADPDYHRQFLKCYNIPELMRGPVTVTPQQFADILKTEGKAVKYVPHLSK